jgi:hypothetical protein
MCVEILKNFMKKTFKFFFIDLPKTMLFKMVSMEFEELVKEEPIPISSDVRKILTPTSFQRLKSAHKNEYRFVFPLFLTFLLDEFC